MNANVNEVEYYFFPDSYMKYKLQVCALISSNADLVNFVSLR